MPVNVNLTNFGLKPGGTAILYKQDAKGNWQFIRTMKDGGAADLDKKPNGNLSYTGAPGLKTYVQVSNGGKLGDANRFFRVVQDARGNAAKAQVTELAPLTVTNLEKMARGATIQVRTPDGKKVLFTSTDNSGKDLDKSANIKFSTLVQKGADVQVRITNPGAKNIISYQYADIGMPTAKRTPTKPAAKPVPKPAPASKPATPNTVTVNSALGLKPGGSVKIYRQAGNNWEHFRTYVDGGALDSDKARNGVITTGPQGVKTFYGINNGGPASSDRYFRVVQQAGKAPNIQEMGVLTVTDKQGMKTGANVEVRSADGKKVLFAFKDNSGSDLNRTSNINFSTLVGKGTDAQVRITNPGAIIASSYKYDNIGTPQAKITPPAPLPDAKRKPILLKTLESNINNMELGLFGGANALATFTNATNQAAANIAKLNKINKNDPTLLALRRRYSEALISRSSGSSYNPGRQDTLTRLTAAMGDANLGRSLAGLANFRSNWSGLSSAQILGEMQESMNQMVTGVSAYANSLSGLVRSYNNAVNAGANNTQIAKALGKPGTSALNTNAAYVANVFDNRTKQARAWMSSNAKHIDNAIKTYQSVSRAEGYNADRQRFAKLLNTIAQVFSGISVIGGLGSLQASVRAVQIRKADINRVDAKITQLQSDKLSNDQSMASLVRQPSQSRLLDKSERLQQDINANIQQRNSYIQFKDAAVVNAAGWSGQGGANVIATATNGAMLSELQKKQISLGPSSANAEVRRIWNSNIQVLGSAESEQLGLAMARFHSLLWQADKSIATATGSRWDTVGDNVALYSNDPIERRDVARRQYDEGSNKLLTTDPAFIASLKTGTMFRYEGTLAGQTTVHGTFDTYSTYDVKLRHYWSAAGQYNYSAFWKK